MGNESILQLFKLSRCFQVPGRAVRAVICCIISVAIPARGAPVCAEELLAASQNPNPACSEPHSCHQPPWDQPSALPGVSGTLYLSHG